jgi:hypothetical protein
MDAGGVSGRPDPQQGCGLCLGVAVWSLTVGARVGGQQPMASTVVSSPTQARCAAGRSGEAAGSRGVGAWSGGWS